MLLWVRPVARRALRPFFVLALLSAGTALALDPGLAITQYRHQVWTTREGLPQSSVETLAQTTDGYLWFGTQEGLVRYDGAGFRVFDRRRVPELLHNRIVALHGDSAGRLWIGTEGGGLTEHYRGRFRTYRKVDGLANERVRSIAADPSGSLWVGTDEGLCRLAGGSFTCFSDGSGLAFDAVSSVAAAPGGGVWVGMIGHGLQLFENGRFVRPRGPAWLDTVSVLDLAWSPSGHLLVSTTRGFLELSGREIVRVLTRENGLPEAPVRAAAVDGAGSLWLGFEGAGLARVRGEKVERFTSALGLSNDSIEALLIDSEGSLWIGTQDGGVNRLMDAWIVPVTVKEGLSHNVTSPIYQDSRGDIWVGTRGGGVNRMRGTSIWHLRQSGGLSNDWVQSIAEDRTGTLWFGTRKGLNRYRDSGVTVYGAKWGLEDESIRAIHEDRRGRLWVGTSSGLFRRDEDEGKWSRVAGSSRVGVFYILEDGAGAIWVATNGDGLFCFERDKVRRYTIADGLSIDIVNTLHLDSEGVLWVGTYGGGLNRFKKGHFSQFTTREGLFDDAVFKILEDGQRNLWISCNRGIYRVSKDELNAFADKTSPSFSLEAFGTADGMKNVECNGADQSTGWKTREGRLFFPTIEGVVHFDPSRIPRETAEPPVLIDELVADGRPMSLEGPLILPPRVGRLEFHFAALSYRTPERIRFRYRLEGFDSAWVEAGSSRSALYTRVPAGSYVFRVMAAHQGGNWGQKGAWVGLDVEPTLFERPAFYILLLVFLAVTLQRAWRYRVGWLERREEELIEEVGRRTVTLREEVARKEEALAEAHRQQEIAQAATAAAEEANRAKSQFLANTSHELRTPLNAILGYSELLRDEALERGLPEFDEDLERIHRAGRHLLDMINDILDLAKIEAGKLELVFEEFSVSKMLNDVDASVRPLVEKNGNRFVVEDPGTLGTMDSDPVRLRQILFNLLSNAGKFTKGGEVRMTASREPAESGDRLLLTVSDTGIGMTPSQLEKLFQPFVQADSTTSRRFGGTGLGLAISKQLCEMMGGTVRVESEPGRGSRFSVTLPARAPRAHDAEAGPARQDG